MANIWVKNVAKCVCQPTGAVVGWESEVKIIADVPANRIDAGAPIMIIQEIFGYHIFLEDVGICSIERRHVIDVFPITSVHTEVDDHPNKAGKFDPYLCDRGCELYSVLFGQLRISKLIDKRTSGYVTPIRNATVASTNSRRDKGGQERAERAIGPQGLVATVEQFQEAYKEEEQVELGHAEWVMSPIVIHCGPNLPGSPSDAVKKGTGPEVIPATGGDPEPVPVEPGKPIGPFGSTQTSSVDFHIPERVARLAFPEGAVSTLKGSFAPGSGNSVLASLFNRNLERMATVQSPFMKNMRSEGNLE